MQQSHFLDIHFTKFIASFSYKWNVTSQILTQASAPALASFPTFPLLSTHRTALTPPMLAFLIGMLRLMFLALHMYTCVSSDPDAQCCPSAVQVREFTLALCCDQRLVMTCDSTVRSTHDPAEKRCEIYLLVLNIEQDDCAARLMRVDYHKTTTKIGMLTSPALSSEPSGENAIALTTPRLPVKAAISFSVLPSHSCR
jgi:hypothetical protein